MSSGASGLGLNVEGLRERLPQQPEAPVKAENVDVAQDAVKELNEQQASEQKDEKDKKTFGRTPDGTGAYTRPSFNGHRASYGWDSEYTVASETSPQPELPCLVPTFFPLTILMP
jgi:hypothetical protein